MSKRIKILIISVASAVVITSFVIVLIFVTNSKNSLDSRSKASTSDFTCSPANFGTASAYNMFILGNVTQSGTDVEGKVAAEGNVNFSGVSINQKNASGNALVAGGSITYTSGNVNGNIVYGGSANIDSNVTVTNGSASQGNPINFETEKTNLKNLSQSLTNLTANGTVTQTSGQFTFTGTNAKANIFTVNSSDLNSANTVHITVPAGSTAIINISGNSLQFKNYSMFLDNIAPANVVFNATQATTLEVSGISVLGSILAPNAAITFNNGNINGNIIGSSLTGNGESHNVLFNGCTPTPPQSSPTPTTAATPTNSPTPVVNTNTPTPTPTPLPTETPKTPNNTPTPTPTATPTNTPTVTPTGTYTPRPTATPTNTPIVYTITETNTPTPTPSPVPTSTPTPTPTPTPTFAPGETRLPPTETPTPLPTETPYIAAATPSSTPTPVLPNTGIKDDIMTGAAVAIGLLFVGYVVNAYYKAKMNRGK